MTPYDSEYADVLLPAVREAGAFVWARFKNPGNIKVKSDSTVVTAVDEFAEKHIIETIRHRFPDHAILAEESGQLGSSKEFCWVIDGLDGTRNYTWNIPLFSVTVALLKNRANLCLALYMHQ